MFVTEVPNIASPKRGGADRPVQLAVYDFDGTLLAGKSPVILTRTLFFNHQLSFGNLWLIMLWGLAYKMHVPPNEAWVRGRVFRAFQGKPRDEVDAYLAWFYDEKIAHRLRASLLEQIQRDREEGCVIVTVSATFEPIVRRMVELGVVDYQIATKMMVDAQGNYVARVDGLPVEGDEKIAALKRFADEQFGRGNWWVKRAYSDHYSDKPLLLAADYATAVHPDTGLKKAAQKYGWTILED